MRSARGQGTVEYLAVVLLVGLALGGGATASARGAGRDIATAVPHQVVRALCIVRGGDCERDRAPCDIGSRTRERAWSANVVVLRLGHSRVLIRERRSDGSVALTLTTAPMLGLEATHGAGGRIKLGRRTLTFGGEVTASVVAAAGHGRTWVLPDEREADVLAAVLAIDADAAPPADQELRRVDVVPGVGVETGTGARVGAGATASAPLSVGASTDGGTGATTYFLEGGVAARADLVSRVPGLRGAASGAGAGTQRYALTVDRAGRWVRLTATRTGEVAATATLPPAIAAVAGDVAAPTRGGRRWITEAHLDLSDPASLAAAQALVAGLRAVPPRPAAAVRAAATVARLLDERGVVDVRTYAVSRTTGGFELHAGAGAGAGVRRETSTEQTRLLAATTRGLDGRWRRRDDCLQEVHP